MSLAGQSLRVAVKVAVRPPSAWRCSEGDRLIGLGHRDVLRHFRRRIKSRIPAWSAAIVQAPAATPVTVDPETVQIVGVSELNVTASPNSPWLSPSRCLPPSAWALPRR